MSVDIEILHALDEVDAVEWDALVEALPRPTPFLLHGWLSAWRRHAPNGDVELVVAHRDGKLAAALPLQVRRVRGLRVAQWLGGRHAQLADALGDPALAPELLARVDADVIDLAGLPRETPLATGLRLVERVAAPVVDLSSGWAALYEAKLSSRRRKEHRKQIRDLEKAGRLEIHIRHDEAALHEALRLHALRWAGRPDTSSYALPNARALHGDALVALGDRPRIALLSLDGTAIAFDYSIRVGDSIVGNGIGFDPAFGRFSPGWVLMLAALEAAADDGVKRFEMLGGDEGYKLQLADPRPLQQGFGARGVAGRVAVGARVGAIRARRRVKRSPLAQRAYAYSVRARRRSTADA